MLYRIGMINEFKGIHSFLEYREYGELRILNVSCCQGTDNTDSGDIYIFLNFNRVGIFKKKSDALGCINKLIAESPINARKDFIAYKNQAFSSIEK